MRKIILFFVVANLLSIRANTVNSPEVQIVFSKPLAIFEFIDVISLERNMENVYSRIFDSSRFNTPENKQFLIDFQMLDLYYSYEFEGFPFGHKQPVNTVSLIKRNLICASSIEDFKFRSIGLLEIKTISNLAKILAIFEPIYETLIYTPNKIIFEKKFEELKLYVKEKNFDDFFQKGVTFYGTKWDSETPIQIAFYPLPESKSFNASAFLNCGISQLRLTAEDNVDLLCVLMHEIYHLVYDEQPKVFKKVIESWFAISKSPSSQFAYQLLNEAMATAAGNGYVYEKLKGNLDKGSWYNRKYINEMAKLIYPTVKTYLENGIAIDEKFIEKYIDLYDKNFSSWMSELDNILCNVAVISSKIDPMAAISRFYPYRSSSMVLTPFEDASLQTISQLAISKLIVISEDNKKQIKQVKQKFPEFKQLKQKSSKSGVGVIMLKDKTVLLVFNVAKGDNYIEMFKKLTREAHLDLRGKVYY